MNRDLPSSLGIYILNSPLVWSLRFEHRNNPICNFDRIIIQLINQESRVELSNIPKRCLKQ